jgi:predicted RNase H-like HicB family nuclease
MKAKVVMHGSEYGVTIEPDAVDGGFIAECPALPGCVTEGETEEEALLNIRCAIAVWLAASQEKSS